jgi:hypothetical protein
VKKHFPRGRRRKPPPWGTDDFSVLGIGKPLANLTEDFMERNIQLRSGTVIYLREDTRGPEAQQTQASGQEATYG